MIKVLFVNHVAEMSGAEHSLLTLVRALDRTSIEPHAAIPHTDSTLGRALADAGVAVHPVRQLGLLRKLDPTSPIRAHDGAAALLRVCRDLRPDVVHANSDTAMIYAAGLWRSGPWRIVWHMRDLPHMGIVRQALARWLQRRSHARIAVSRAVADRYALATGPHDRVIPNGVELARFRPGAPDRGLRAELGVPPNRPLALCIGQWVAWKRLTDFTGLPGAEYDRLLVTYPPPGTRAQPGVSARSGLHVLGYQSDIERVYAAADMLVHPAVGEAYGRTVAEALACGLPVVAYDQGGPAELVLHEVSGLLVPPGDTRALAAAVWRLALDPELRARLVKGAVAGRDRLSSEAHAAAVQALYHDLVCGGGAA